MHDCGEKNIDEYGDKIPQEVQREHIEACNLDIMPVAADCPFSVSGVV